MGATIPTWPVLLTEWGAPYNANGGLPAVQRVDISDRVLTSNSVKRGKQYELDTAQAGELTNTLRNNDAVLDPTNTSGPFAGHIAPYQPFQIRAQYPPTPNLLPYVVATCGEGYSAGLIPSSFGIYAGTDPTGGQIVVPGDAYQGTNVFQFNVPNTYGAGQFILGYTTSAAPLTQYSLQAHIRNVAAGTTGPVQLAVGWFGPSLSAGPLSWSYGSVVTAVGASSGATWYGLTETMTAPASACGMAVGIVTGGTAAANWNMQCDALQLEKAVTPTAFIAPGTWYPLFTGFIERWPTQWKDSGTYGTVTPTITDALALLSQGQLSDPLTQEINAIGPTWLYRLDDPSSAVQAAEANGKFPPLNTVSSVSGAGSVTFGNAIAATTAAGVFNTGGQNGGSCVSVTAPVAGSSSPSAVSVLSLDESGIKGPSNPRLWTRMIAIRWTGTGTPAVGAVETVWSSFDFQGNGIGGSIQLQLNPQGGTSNNFAMGISLPLAGGGNTNNGPISVFPSGFNACDGNWHLVIFGYNDASQTAFCSIDGVTAGMSQALGSGGWTPTIARDSLGGYLNGGYQGAYELNGDIAYAAEFPSYLTATQVTNLYSAWRNACSGETSAARYTRILRYANYTGPTNIGSGCLTTDMGPASDLDGSDALSCLENVVVTENGTHFAAKDGTITFQGRGFRYLNPTPAFTFGENAASGEFPYEDLQLDFDTTHLADDVTVTQQSTSQEFYAVSATDEAEYFDRTMTRTVNVNSSFEAQDAANFLVSRYGVPLTRVTMLKLNPAGQPALWPIVLQLELGMCIQINRRPFGCPMISLLLWIEQMQWDISDDGTATVQLQCSPVMAQPQATFTAWRTLLASTAASGQPTITVVPPTFDTVNPLNAYITPGMSLTVHSSATATYTVKSVQATGSHWSTGTITFTTNLAGSVASGNTVNEVTSGATNGAFDANAVFDTAVFTY